MNYAMIIRNLADKTRLICQTLWFRLVQKPLWLLSFNGGGSEFRCEGSLRGCKLIFNTGGGNKLIISNNAVLNNVVIKVLGENCTVEIGEGVVFSTGGSIIVEDNGSSLKIGKRSSFVRGAFMIRDNGTSVSIGDDCMFSVNTMVRTSDAHSILDADSGKRINPGRNVVIGDRVWVGFGATILKGSVIGDDCIIGTESVVPGMTVPPGCVAAGNPAKVVKSGIRWDVRRLSNF